MIELSDEDKAIVRAAVERMRDPSIWTRGGMTNARDANGNEVRSYEPEAVCWCAEGHLDVASRFDDDAVRRITKAVDGTLFQINDRDGREAAIAALEALL